MKLWCLGVSAVGVLAVVGCVNAEVSPVSVSQSAVSPVVSVTPSPSPSPIATPTSTLKPTPTPTAFESYPGNLPTEDVESAAIIAGWQEYQRVLGKFLADPEGYTDFSETQYVTTGDQSNHILRNIEIYREDQMRNLGGLAFDSMSFGDAWTLPTGAKQVELTYCLDRTSLKVETYAGEPYSTGSLTPRYVEHALMEQGPDEIWRVALIWNNADEPC